MIVWKKSNNNLLIYDDDDAFGCLSETIESAIDDGGVIAPEEYSWEDDGELVIVTYDVTGLTDELISNLKIFQGMKSS